MSEPESLTLAEIKQTLVAIAKLPRPHYAVMSTFAFQALCAAWARDYVRRAWQRVRRLSPAVVATRIDQLHPLGTISMPPDAVALAMRRERKRQRRHRRNR